MSSDQLCSRLILGTRIDATSYADATERVLAWAKEGASRVVVAANVHTVIEARDDVSFQETVNAADLVTPDGVPLVWVLRKRGVKDSQRVYGPDLTLAVCEAAAEREIPVGFYGSTPEVLDDLVANLERRFPTLRVVYRYSPPFRSLTPEEETQTVQAIRASGARVLLVGLGCPKQERWMLAHRGTIPAVMLGVGAAFDFHAGRTRQAPRWVMGAGLEWAFRLLVEPRRLLRRYVRVVPKFMVLTAPEFLGLRPRRGG